MERRGASKYRGVMRSTIFASVIAITAACGSDHSSGNVDSNNTVDTSNTVDTPLGTPTTITLTLTNHPTTAATYSFLVGYQDGAGAWQLAPAPTGDVYTFTVSSPAYGVAWTCVGIGGVTREVNLTYYSTTEKTAITQGIPLRCTDRITAVSLTGTITNPAVLGTMSVGFAGTTVTATKTGVVTSYVMDGLAPATRDLVIGNDTIGGTIGTTDRVIGKALVQRNVAVTANTTEPAIDFSTATATTSAPVTAAVTGNQRAHVATTLFAHGTQFVLVNQSSTAGGQPPNGGFVTNGLGTAVAADIYNQQITVNDATTGAAAVVQNWTGTIAAQTYVAPAALGLAATTVPTTTPYPMIETTWSAYSNATGYAWSALQALAGASCGPAVNACRVTWTALVSPGYAGTAPLTQMPDLSPLAGWDAKLQFATGTAVAVTIAAFLSSIGAADFPPPSPAPDGTQRAEAAMIESVTP
jgi:hypothetical protein